MRDDLKPAIRVVETCRQTNADLAVGSVPAHIEPFPLEEPYQDLSDTNRVVLHAPSYARLCRPKLNDPLTEQVHNFLSLDLGFS